MSALLLSDDRTILPHNIEAEQAVLGALLVNNEALDRLEGLGAGHFYEPFHARIFDAISGLYARNLMASPVTLKTYFDQDPVMAALGGPAYFGRLAGAAVTIFDVAPYGQLVRDLAIRRNLILLCEETAAAARNPDVNQPPRELLEVAENGLFQLAEIGQTNRGFMSFEEALRGASDMAAKAYQRDGGLSGVGTGFIDLDKLLGGMRGSDLLILAARPSMGKTALATNIAFNAARDYAYQVRPDGSRETIRGGQVGFFSLEMSAEQLALRILAEQTGIRSDLILHGRISEQEMYALQECRERIQTMPLHIDPTGSISLAALAQKARRLKRQKGLDLIVIDYLQLITAGATRDSNRVQEVSAITQGLKALAKELNVPVLALSQLSRKVEDREDKRPQLADLRESGSIEQDADVVMFIYREEYYLSRLKPARQEEEEGSAKWAAWKEKMDAVVNTAEVLIGKQRNGPIGSVELLFDSGRTKFANLARLDQ
jgi:replicative DNA helicase